MDFTVRQARLDDIQQMCGLLSELFSIESDFKAEREKQARGLHLLINDKSGSSLILVAEKDSEIIGMCSVQALISTAEGGPAGLLEDLIVRKDHRGNRIGTRLLSRIFNWCLTKNISRIQLLRETDNMEARKFYINKGLSDTKLICMRKVF